MPTLKLEAIADDSVQALARLTQAERTLGIGRRGDHKQRRPWVAEIVGEHDHYGLDRRFLDGQKDFSEANSIGSRGVYLYYHLREGHIYEINDVVSWSKADRYFAMVCDGGLVRMGEEEVLARVGA